MDSKNVPPDPAPEPPGDMVEAIAGALGKDWALMCENAGTPGECQRLYQAERDEVLELARLAHGWVEGMREAYLREIREWGGTGRLYHAVEGIPIPAPGRGEPRGLTAQVVSLLSGIENMNASDYPVVREYQKVAARLYREWAMPMIAGTDQPQPEGELVKKRLGVLRRRRLDDDKPEGEVGWAREALLGVVAKAVEHSRNTNIGRIDVLESAYDDYAEAVAAEARRGGGSES